MKGTSRISALLLALALCLSLAACGGGETGAFQIADTLDADADLNIAFRAGDKAGDYVLAALQVLAAEGTVHEIALRWFVEDDTCIQANAEALDTLEPAETRIFIVGIDAQAFPMSYEEDGHYTGFDVELATAVCSRLGWEIQLQPIEPENAAVELAAGNIDAAWGGMSFDAATDGESLRVSDAYMENQMVLVTLAGSGLNRKSQLKGRSIAVSDSERSMALLAEDSTLSGSLEHVTRFSAGEQACLEAVRDGVCDAALVNAYVAAYYMR